MRRSASFGRHEGADGWTCHPRACSARSGPSSGSSAPTWKRRGSIRAAGARRAGKHAGCAPGADGPARAHRRRQSAGRCPRRVRYGRSRLVRSTGPGRNTGRPARDRHCGSLASRQSVRPSGDRTRTRRAACSAPVAAAPAVEAPAALRCARRKTDAAPEIEEVAESTVPAISGAAPLPRRKPTQTAAVRPRNDEPPLPRPRPDGPAPQSVWTGVSRRRTFPTAIDHDPEKACPGHDPGWEPVFGKRMLKQKISLHRAPALIRCG